MKKTDIRVRCGRQIHTIRMYRGGPIVLLNHPPDMRDADRAVEALDGKRMFCYEILECFRGAGKHVEATRPLQKLVRDRLETARSVSAYRGKWCSHVRDRIEIELVRRSHEEGAPWLERQCAPHCTIEKDRPKGVKLARVVAKKLAEAAPANVTRIECHFGTTYWGADAKTGIDGSYGAIRVWLASDYYEKAFRLLRSPLVDGYFVAKVYPLNGFLMATVVENPLQHRIGYQEHAERRAILYENPTGWHLRFPDNWQLQVSGISKRKSSSYESGLVGRFL